MVPIQNVSKNIISLFCPTHVHIRLQSYYQYKYDSTVEAAVNKQIQAEQQAAQNYLSMAVIFLHPVLSLPGAGSFFMKMYEEELCHMKELIKYQLLRGGIPIINGLKEPPSDINLTLLDAYKKALEMEKMNTKMLEDLISVAENVKDYHCVDYITSTFLTEQFQSINKMAHHITKLKRLYNNEHGIYHFDMELAKTT